MSWTRIVIATEELWQSLKRNYQGDTPHWTRIAVVVAGWILSVPAAAVLLAMLFGLGMVLAQGAAALDNPETQYIERAMVTTPEGIALGVVAIGVLRFTWRTTRWGAGVLSWLWNTGFWWVMGGAVWVLLAETTPLVN